MLDNARLPFRVFERLHGCAQQYVVDGKLALSGDA
jgi:hypothetical protein